MSEKFVFKIMAHGAWRDACSAGEYSGSSDDKRDGFIHLSSADQLAGTLEKHFGAQSDLVLIRFCSYELAPHLKWEPSRRGALFPHYYGALDPTLALDVQPIALAANGQHLLPETQA